MFKKTTLGAIIASLAGLDVQADFGPHKFELWITVLLLLDMGILIAIYFSLKKIEREVSSAPFGGFFPGSFARKIKKWGPFSRMKSFFGSTEATTDDDSYTDGSESGAKPD